MSRIPSWWTGGSAHKTKGDLLAHRKKSKIHSKTFDLDADGEVGPTDLFVASHFDKDKDGILNAKEHKEALEALRQGFLNKFHLGAENRASTRLVQQRGVVISGDDFSGLKSTYPSLLGTR